MPSTLPGKQQMPWFRRWGMKYDLDSTRLVGVLTSPSTARIRMLQPWQWPWCLWCAMQIWSNHMKSGSFHVHSMGFFRGIQTDSLQVLALCSTDQHCQHRSSQDSFWRGPGSFSFFSQPSKFVQSSRDFCGSLRELLQILSCAVVHFREVMIVMQICQCLITVRCQDLPLINFGELMTEQFMAWTTNSAIYSRNGHLAVVNCLAELNYLRPNPFLCESTVLSHPFATFHLCNKHPFDFFTLFFSHRFQFYFYVSRSLLGCVCGFRRGQDVFVFTQAEPAGLLKNTKSGPSNRPAWEFRRWNEISSGEILIWHFLWKLWNRLTY